MGDAVYSAGFWIIFSPILVEGVAMVFAAMFRQKTRQEGRAEGHQEGREEMNTVWREWNQRRLQAMADGMPFDEPTPDTRNGTDAAGP